MSRGKPAHEQAFMLRHPWSVSLGSAAFVLAMLWCGASVGWDLTASIGSGHRHVPLWVLLLLGMPLFGAGVVVGIVRQVRLWRGR